MFIEGAITWYIIKVWFIWMMMKLIYCVKFPKLTGNFEFIPVKMCFYFPNFQVSGYKRDINLEITVDF